MSTHNHVMTPQNGVLARQIKRQEIDAKRCFHQQGRLILSVPMSTMKNLQHPLIVSWDLKSSKDKKNSSKLENIRQCSQLD